MQEMQTIGTPVVIFISLPSQYLWIAFCTHKQSVNQVSHVQFFVPWAFCSCSYSHRLGWSTENLAAEGHLISAPAAQTENGNSLGCYPL